MSTARQYAPHYTAKDYLTWQGDWELWEGMAIAMTPSPFGGHQRLVTRLCRLLGNALESAHCQAEPVAELDWIVASDTVVRPDVMVACGEIPDKHMDRVPELVAEVLSSSTRQNDLVYKRQLYLKLGVAYYLVVDPENQSMQIDQRQANGNYSDWQVDLKSQSSAEITLRLCETCAIRFPLAHLFR